ncbi:MAG: acyl-CoA dehydrogenase [Rhizobiales bacterium]|nr:acyl-CoA dehydrogenase [Hyphomicrobiales bacterium]
MAAFLFVLLVAALAFALAIHRARLVVWAGFAALVTLLVQSGVTAGALTLPSLTGLSLLGWLPAAVLALLSVPAIRRALIVRPAFSAVRRILPKVSETEQEALQAGTIGWDAQLFSGTPDWRELRAVPGVVLTDEERAFLEGPTEELCKMVDDWQIRHHRREIPDEIWSFVKRHGFLGMLISKAHGGLGFSAQAQSLILGKVSSRSPDVATIVMVPNSLGPGELIEKYGTDHQKEYYLPRLARGDEIPCFGLTGPNSGSDAATMRDIGVVTRGMHDGREVLGIRLDIDKRYITLAPVATLVGLAFRLHDPEHLIGERDEIGITVALVPAGHPGLVIGNRHLPAQGGWPNGPISGSGIFIPIDWIIGGKAMAGQGWRMLMECLSAGRAISLPSSSTAGIKTMLRTTSAYARIRKQFGIAIGRMEGIDERIARLVEHAYTVEAARAATAAMVSRGEKPAVISALMKYQATERMRQAVADAMDVHAGRAVCDGPTNYLFGAYQMIPVGITVEGANILTRSLITFAQGALRSHPYLYAEISALQEADGTKGLAAFEKAFLSHVSFAVSNVAASLWNNLTGGRFLSAPEGAGEHAHWYRQLARASRNFALVADLSVALLGGGLKSRQRITGRMADALSELYLLSCVLKRYEDDGRPEVDRAIVALCAQNCLDRFEEQLYGAVENFPVAPARWLMRLCAFTMGGAYRPAADTLGRHVASLVLEPGAVRDRLTRDIFISTSASDPMGLLEIALPKVVAAEAVERKLEKAIREGKVRRFHGHDWIAEAVAKAILTGAEGEQLREVDGLVQRVIAVDQFTPAELVPAYGHGEARPGAGIVKAAE